METRQMQAIVERDVQRKAAPTLDAVVATLENVLSMWGEAFEAAEPGGVMELAYERVRIAASTLRNTYDLIK